MNRYRVTLFAMLVLIVPPIGNATVAARLVVDAPAHDFGTVEQGELVQHRFALSNDGAEELRIDAIDAPCGCTAAVASTLTLPPGGTADLNVTFDTTRFVGRKKKTVSISTSDPEAPVVDVMLSGKVTPPIVVDPPVLYLGRIRPGTEAIGGVRILSTSGTPVRVLDAQADNPVLDVAIESLSSAGRAGQQVVVRLAPEARRGRFSDTLRVSTSHPAASRLEVPIFGSVEGDLIVSPAHVTFKAPPVGRLAARDVHIENTGSRPIRISGVRVANLAMDYAVRTVRAGFEYQIQLRLRHVPSSSSAHGSLVISTTHPEEPELVVPLYAVIGSTDEP
jgi:hypothetical protein